MNDELFSVAVDAAAEIVFEVKQINIAGIGLNFIPGGDFSDRFADDGRRGPSEQVVLKDGCHPLFKRGQVGDEHEEAVFAKKAMEDTESGGLDIRAFEIAFFQQSDKFRAEGLDGELAFEAKEQLFQACCFYPPR